MTFGPLTPNMLRIGRSPSSSIITSCGMFDLDDFGAKPLDGYDQHILKLVL